MSAFWHFAECTGMALIQVLSLTLQRIAKVTIRHSLSEGDTLRAGLISRQIAVEEESHDRGHYTLTKMLNG